jgi:hypothetical protein
MTTSPQPLALTIIGAWPVPKILFKHPLKEKYGKKPHILPGNFELSRLQTHPGIVASLRLISGAISWGRSLV